MLHVQEIYDPDICAAGVPYVRRQRAAPAMITKATRRVVVSLIALLGFFNLAPLAHGQRLLLGPEKNTLANAPNGLGMKKTAAILFNCDNNPGDRPFSPDDARHRLFTDPDSTSKFLFSVSFGQLAIVGNFRRDGDVFGWFSVPCPGGSTGFRTADINRMAQAAGFNEANYDVVYYIHPQHL